MLFVLNLPLNKCFDPIRKHQELIGYTNLILTLFITNEFSFTFTSL